MNLHKHHKQSHCKQEKIALWTPPRESAYENIPLFFYYVLRHLKHPYPAYVCHIALFNVLKFICLWCCFLFQTPVYSCALACHHPALNPKFVDQIFVSDLHHSVVVHTSTWLAAESTKVCHIAQQVSYVPYTCAHDAPRLIISFIKLLHVSFMA